MVKITLTDSSTVEDYKNLFTLEVGEVFKVTGNYETAMRRIEELTPEGMTFEVFPINPGTSLYTTYGCDHCVVVEKKIN